MDLNITFDGNEWAFQGLDFEQAMQDVLEDWMVVALDPPDDTLPLGANVVDRYFDNELTDNRHSFLDEESETHSLFNTSEDE